MFYLVFCLVLDVFLLPSGVPYALPDGVVYATAQRRPGHEEGRGAGMGWDCLHVWRTLQQSDGQRKVLWDRRDGSLHWVTEIQQMAVCVRDLGRRDSLLGMCWRSLNAALGLAVKG